MRASTVVVRSPLPPAEAFAALTDWPAHGRHVALTTVSVVHDAGGVGTTFRARTGLGRVGFDDDMRVTRWEPPQDGGGGRCEVLKTGRVLRGGADIEVQPDGDGSRVRWSESIGFGPRWLEPVVDRAAALPSRLVFGRVTRQLLRDRERGAGRG